MDTTRTDPAPGGPPPRPSGTDSFFDSVRGWGLVRAEDRWVGGVAAGLARRWGLDPALVRALGVASLLLGGVGIVAYGAAWLLLPEESDGRIHAQQLVRGDVDAAAVGGILMVALGFSWTGPWRFLGGWGDGINAFFWVVAVIAVVVWLATSRGQTGATNRPAGAPAPPPPAGTAWAHASGPSQGPDGTSAPAWGATTSQGDGTSSDAGAPSADSSWSSTAAPTPSAAGTAPTWTPPRGPVVLGAGAVSVSLVVGLTALTAAGLLLAERAGRFDGPVLLTTLAVLVALAGVATVVAGIRGRSSGSLGGLAVVALVVAVPSAMWHGTGLDLDIRRAETLVLGDRSSTPTDVAAAERGFVLGAGSWTLDLTEVPLGGATVEVPMSFAMGDATVVLPEGAAWVADVRLGVGDVEVVTSSGGSTSRSTSDGVGVTRTVESTAVRDGAVPALRLDLRAGLGSVKITEESR